MCTVITFFCSITRGTLEIERAARASPSCPGLASKVRAALLPTALESPRDVSRVDVDVMRRPPVWSLKLNTGAASAGDEV